MRQPKLFRKGQISNVSGNIVTLIVMVGIAVLALIYIGVLSGAIYVNTEDELTNIGNNVVTGDTFTALNNTKVALDHGMIQTGTLAIYNASGLNEVFTLSNFTVDYDVGTVTLKSASPIQLNNSALAANYTWGAAEIRTHVNDAVISGFEAIEVSGNYLPIIVLAVIIAIVLTLVIGFTAFGKGREGNAL